MTSFIIPAHNEELELAATVDAIRAAASHATQRYEIIVIDDASTDGTAEIASRAGAKVIRINRRQIAASRNAGGRAAQGEYLRSEERRVGKVQWRRLLDGGVVKM